MTDFRQSLGSPGAFGYGLRVDQNRLTEVETRYTYLERLVQELSTVLHEQQRTIEGLTVRLKRLEASITEAMDPSREPMPHEKPPHY